MCGRITQKSNPRRLGLGLATVDLVEPLYNLPPKYNGAPGQVLRQHPRTGTRTLDRLWWGLIPSWCRDASGGRRPINAKAETVAELPSFRDAYRSRRCLLPVDSFFEWQAIKGGKAKQPFAIAMKSGAPFALGSHLAELAPAGK
jgi:putative SOS response-associated peptidase YedK